MSHVVVLDAGPLGLVTNPKHSPQSAACVQWLHDLVVGATRVILPEIVDYEIRRELLRANKRRGLTKLDAMIGLLEYLPLTTAAMRRAAEFWAQARQQGRPTAGDRTIDADVILAGQVATLGATNVVVATTNIGHLSRFVPAELWPNITA